ncbi:TetR/AcrR family transcriptional regulator [Bacterioplanoides sp.]|uniref:TetR/AcrR family transcriptional regulator n=1 Tax=Bacterioplanoides sp. TaxID=2066072 RepID=UPI003B5B7D6E
MARRKDHTHEQIQTLAIESLQQHLAEQPLGNMSLRKLAQRIGYSPGTLINVFGSYDQLLLSVNAATLDSLSAQLTLQPAAEQQENKQQPLQRLLAYGQSYLQFAEQNRYLWQLLFEHRLPEGEEVPDWQQQRIDGLFHTVEQALTQVAPQANAATVQQAARTIWASVHGVCSLSLDDKLFADSLTDAGAMIESLIRNYVMAWSNQADV